MPISVVQSDINCYSLQILAVLHTFCHNYIIIYHTKIYRIVIQPKSTFFVKMGVAGLNAEGRLQMGGRYRLINFIV